ncbi:coagulation factor 5/8 type domain protein [Pseudopedobacter saltans DSM 12145]|uniref:Coagulation factor 5/8 type domain protein n=1 Tax=Pseudopedobacter saltans (strain ATCC 51119 / DSM 12145 / JCM 21818 / CCUG 39354 / LMG 10337 / NBRC 100064 / NCIMB 13643) TaxID=762903 RepID=F0SD04_PSESL|nr:chondroitinase-B domain-containing protein [Pseudopedobacter saltans]ADY51761.1 coagulation factor 5/8 type domain protein [Pseudopedobacter saltans DSM 12145]
MKSSLKYLLATFCIAISICFSYAQTAKKTKSARRLITVKNTEELKNVLEIAKPGDSIVMSDGEYMGKFVIPANANGTKEKPITLIGTKKCVLTTGKTDNGYVLHHQASNWIIKGFMVKGGLKGIILDGASNNLLDDLEVTQIGEEGIHFRKFSSNNKLQNSKIHHVGLLRPGYGEGVYIGSAVSNWARYTNGEPDRCDSNAIINNVIGPYVPAECIDIKEGTTGGIIRGNTFYSEGISGENSADSWIDVKGNNYLIERNKGINTQPSALLDGYQVNCAVDGWGNHNEFKNNICEVNADGYGINIRLKSSKGAVVGNKVFSDNQVINAKSGVANIPLSE